MNRKLIRVFGLQRSGLHAVCDWIKLSLAEQSGYSATFENDVSVDRPNEIAKFLPAKGDLAEPFLWMTEHEDSVLIDLPLLNPKLAANYEITDVLVVRDLFNTLASRRKLDQKLFNRRSVQLWKQFLFEAQGKTTFLGPNKVVVNFNDWSANKERERVAASLGITGVGAKTDKLAVNSSWQPPTTPVAELQLTERWKNYKEDATFWAVFDKSLYELNASVFGGNDEVAALIK